MYSTYKIKENMLAAILRNARRTKVARVLQSQQQSEEPKALSAQKHRKGHYQKSQEVSQAVLEICHLKDQNYTRNFLTIHA